MLKELCSWLSVHLEFYSSCKTNISEPPRELQSETFLTVPGLDSSTVYDGISTFKPLPISREISCSRWRSHRSSESGSAVKEWQSWWHHSDFSYKISFYNFLTAAPPNFWNVKIELCFLICLRLQWFELLWVMSSSEHGCRSNCMWKTPRMTSSHSNGLSRSKKCEKSSTLVRYVDIFLSTPKTWFYIQW